MPERVPLPPRFLVRMSRLLGGEFTAFATALENDPVSGLRVNTLKLSMEEFERISPFPLGESIPWEASARLLPPAPLSAGLHPYHLAGLYYIQDPSAMAPAALLDPQPSERVLDLAAAPGGKTTHLACRMQGKGLLVANEIKDKRLGHLAMNVERWGAGNILVTNETPEHLADHFGATFDRVLVDAPCSGEGMFRKDMGARRDWSSEMVAGCAVRQRNILGVAEKLVRPGGVLMYSTCTFAPEEDEAVIASFLETHQDFSVVELPFFQGFEPGRPDWLERGGMGSVRASTLSGSRRLFPHRMSGDGHFVCLLKKTGSADGYHGFVTEWGQEMNRIQDALWESFRQNVLAVDLPAHRLRVQGERLYLVPEIGVDIGRLRMVHMGVWLGSFKTGRFEPAHPLALYLQASQVQRTLDLAGSSREVNAYLRGETLNDPGPSGWLLVSVDGWPLGWGKRVQGVVKNHYPRGWLRL